MLEFLNHHLQKYFHEVSVDKNPSVSVVSSSELNKSGEVSPSTPKFSSPLETCSASNKYCDQFRQSVVSASSEKDCS